MRPGRPLMHGRLGAMHVLGLPGNPVSSYVCAFLFLVPLIRRMTGRSDIDAADRIGGARLRTAGKRRACRLSARETRNRALTGRSRRPFAIQDSSMMVPLGQADCLVIREPYAPPAASRQPVPNR